MQQHTLTTLSQAYIDGKLAREDYREQRRNMIKQQLAEDKKRNIKAGAIEPVRHHSLNSPVATGFSARTKITAGLAASFVIVLVALSAWQPANPISAKYEYLMQDNRFDIDENEVFMAAYQQATAQQQQQWIQTAKQERLQYADSTNPQDIVRYQSLTALLIELDTKRWEQSHTVSLKNQSVISRR